MYLKCKGNFTEVKCFVICTDLLLSLKVNFYVIKIGIRIRNAKKNAIESESVEFGRIAIPVYSTTN